MSDKLNKILSPTETTSTSGAPVAQERFTPEEMATISEEFAKRLIECFPNLNRREIARQLKTTESTVKWYADGVRLPNFEMLLQIYRTANISMNWLVLGKGKKHEIEYGQIFSNSELAEIEALAKENDRSFEDEIRALATAQLSALKTYKNT